MIKINLLPDEYRRSERTSPKIFAAVLLAVISVCCSVGWFGLVYFGELGELEAKHVSVSEQLKSMKDSVAYHGALTAEKKDFQVRAKTIDKISRSRALWTPIVDQLIDTVNNDGDIERHMAWFKSISVKESARGGPVMNLPGAVQGEEFRRLADFHEDVEHTPFYRFVTRKSEPAGQLKTEPEKRPAQSLGFTMVLEFEKPEKWAEIIDPSAAKHEDNAREKGKK